MIYSMSVGATATIEHKCSAQKKGFSGPSVHICCCLDNVSRDVHYAVHNADEAVCGPMYVNGFVRFWLHPCLYLNLIHTAPIFDCTLEKVVKVWKKSGSGNIRIMQQ